MMSQYVQASFPECDRPALPKGRAKNQGNNWVARTLEDAARQGLAIGEARATSRQLLRHLFAEIGLSTPDANGLERQVARLTAVVAQQWMNCIDRGRSFESVALSLLSGMIGGQKVEANLLLETVLVEAVSQRDIRAIEVFVQKYDVILMRLLHKVGGERAVQELEGLITDVVERPDRYLDGYKGSATLSRWLSTIARSAWVSRTRALNREERRRASLRVSTTECHAENLEVRLSGDDEACHAALLEIARKALQTLTDRESLMLRMVILDGVTQAEFARTVGCDKATITRSMTRARTRIQQRVHELIESSGSASALREYIESISGTLVGDVLDLGSCLAQLLQSARSNQAVSA